MSLTLFVLCFLLVRVTKSTVLSVEDQNINRNLEKCLNNIFRRYSSPTEYLFFLNFNTKFENIKFQQPVIVVNKLQQLKTFQIFKANFCVIIATHFDTILNFFSNAIFWNPRAMFLVIQENYTDDIFYLAHKQYIFNLTVLVPNNNQVKVITYLNESKTLGLCSDVLKHDVNLFSKRPAKDNVTFKLYYQQYAPYTFYINETYIDGLDIVMFKLIKEALNLSIKYVHSTEYSWGYKLPNGSYDGAYSLLEKNEVDMLMGGFIMNETNILDFELTFPYMDDFYTWVVPSGEREPTWKKTLNIFHYQAWIIITIFFIVISVLLYFLVLYTDQNRTLHDNYFLICYKCLLGQSVNELPGLSAIRIVFGMWLFGSLILSSCFQGRLISALTFKTYNKPITNSDELMESKMRFGYIEENQILFFNNNKKSEYFSQNFYKCPPTNYCFEQVAYQKNLAMLDFEKSIMYWVLIDKKNKPVIYILNEKLLNVYFVLVFKKGHPLFEQINLLIWHICSHGFMDFIVDGFYKYAEMMRLINLEIQTVKPLKLVEIMWIFFWHVMFLLVAFICFILELIVNRISNLKCFAKM